MSGEFSLCHEFNGMLMGSIKFDDSWDMLLSVCGRGGGEGGSFDIFIV